MLLDSTTMSSSLARLITGTGQWGGRPESLSRLTFLNDSRLAQVFASLELFDQGIDGFLLDHVDEKKILLLIGTL